MMELSSASNVIVVQLNAKDGLDQNDNKSNAPDRCAPGDFFVSTYKNLK
jgi:hypothetical protein